MTAGSAAAFCDEIRDRLVRSLTLYCGDPWVAEELAQDALVRAWERWATVRQLDSPEAWTFRVAMNLANSWFRRRAAERRAHSRLQGGLAPVEADVAAAVAVRSVVAGLPERQRATLVARFYMDLTVEATAELLGCAEGTVRATTHQAVAQLRASGLDVDEVLEEVL
jgi:RNA polymerase sigma-70 factor (ECF subfamily)